MAIRTYTWVNTGNGDWSVAGNWLPTAVPNRGSIVDITRAGLPFDIDVDVNASLSTLDLLSTSATLEIGDSLESGSVFGALSLANGGENDGKIEVQGEGRLKLTGDLANNGAVQINSRASGAGIVLDGGSIYGGTVTSQSDAVLAVLSGTNTLATNLTLSGRLVVCAGATLVLSSIVSATSGRIIAQDAATPGGTAASIELLDVAVDGGTLRSVGNAAFYTGTGYDSELDDTRIALGTTLQVKDGTGLHLDGSIVNGGTIKLDATGTTTADATELKKIDGSVALSGKGTITLSDDGNPLLGSGKNSISGGTLDNVNETIIGTGIINVTAFTNERGGVIKQSGAAALWLGDNVDAQTYYNDGLIELDGDDGVANANSSVGLSILNSLVNNGTLFAYTGNLYVTSLIGGTGKEEIGSGALVMASATDAKVSFTEDAGLFQTWGRAFNGTIAGLSTDGGNAIDLVDVNYYDFTYNEPKLADLSFKENAAGTRGTLTLGTVTNHVSITLIGDYVNAFNPAPGAAGFVLSYDGTDLSGTKIQYYASAPSHAVA